MEAYEPYKVFLVFGDICAYTERNAQEITSLCIVVVRDC